MWFIWFIWFMLFSLLNNSDNNNFNNNDNNNDNDNIMMIIWTYTNDHLWRIPEIGVPNKIILLK